MRNRLNFHPPNGSLIDVRPTIVPRLGLDRWLTGLGVFAIASATACFSFGQLWSGLGMIPKEFPDGFREYDRGSWEALMFSWVFFVPSTIGVLSMSYIAIWNGLIRETLKLDGCKLTVVQTLLGKGIYEKSIDSPRDVTATILQTGRDRTAFGFWDVSLQGAKYVTVKSGDAILEFGVCLTPGEADLIADHLQACINSSFELKAQSEKRIEE